MRGPFRRPCSVHAVRGRRGVLGVDGLHHTGVGCAHGGLRGESFFLPGNTAHASGTKAKFSSARVGPSQLNKVCCAPGGGLWPHWLGAGDECDGRLLQDGNFLLRRVRVCAGNRHVGASQVASPINSHTQHAINWQAPQTPFNPSACRRSAHELRVTRRGMCVYWAGRRHDTRILPPALLSSETTRMSLLVGSTWTSSYHQRSPPCHDGLGAGLRGMSSPTPGVTL